MKALTVTKDITKEVNGIIAKFKRDVVLVGIPESSSERDDGGITNAAILAINEFGSPANNIPARPVLEIGIRNAQREISEQFARSAKAALSGDVGEVSAAYQRAGIVASVSVKKAINAQEGIEPPAAATLAARERMGFKGTKALVVTGQMRNSITYVVKE